MKERVFLFNIALMRVFLVLFIIIDHCFMPFTGSISWKPLVPDMQEYSVYKLISVFSVTVSLGCFVFVSGYLCKSNSIDNLLLQLKTVFFKKGKRLLVPAFVFGALFCLLFHPFISIQDSIYFVVNGAGHLWFLVMLFWCFVFSPFLDRWFKNQEIPKWVILILLSLFFSLLSLPFRISTAFFYLPLFEFGKSFKKFESRFNLGLGRLFVCIAILFVLLSIYYIMRGVNIDLYTGIQRVLIKVSVSIAQLTSFFLSSIVIFELCKILSNKISEDISLFVTRISAASMVIYIFQEFIIRLLYYYLGIQLYVPITLTPFFAVLITFFIAYIMTILCLNNNYLKQLL